MKSSPWRLQSRAGVHPTLRQVAAEGLAAMVEVLHLAAVLRRLVERCVDDLLVGYRNVEAVAELAQLVLIELLLLVRDVPALAGFAEAVALDGFGQDHGRRPWCSTAAL